MSAATRTEPRPAFPRPNHPELPEGVHGIAITDGRSFLPFQFFHGRNCSHDALVVAAYLDGIGMGPARWQDDKTIARMTAICKRSVQFGIRELREKGFIYVDHQHFNGRNRRVIFLLWKVPETFPRLDKEGPEDAQTPDPPSARSCASPSARSCAPRAQTVCAPRAQDLALPLPISKSVFESGIEIESKSVSIRPLSLQESGPPVPEVPPITPVVEARAPAPAPAEPAPPFEPTADPDPDPTPEQVAAWQRQAADEGHGVLVRNNRLIARMELDRIHERRERAAAALVPAPAPVAVAPPVMPRPEPALTPVMPRWPDPAAPRPELVTLFRRVADPVHFPGLVVVEEAVERLAERLDDPCGVATYRARLNDLRDGRLLVTDFLDALAKSQGRDVASRARVFTWVLGVRLKQRAKNRPARRLPKCHAGRPESPLTQ